MKYTVIRRFTCKLDGKHYQPCETYETSDPERAAFLQNKGRIGKRARAKKADEAGNGDEPDAERHDNL